MSFILHKKDLDEDHRFTQKCCLPPHVLKNSHIKIGDFISVNCDFIEYICRVFPSSSVEKHIILDDTVSFYKNYKVGKCKVSKQVFHIPEDISIIKIFTCKKVQIKIEYQESLNNYSLSLNQLAEISLKLLNSYVVRKDSILNYKGHELADIFRISKLHISDTIFEINGEEFENIYGRICRTTNVEIIGIISFDQSKFLREYVEVGGFDDAIEQLHFNIKVCRRILVIGPPGCGKTTLIKKFCCGLNSFVLMLDSFSDLSLEKCKSYCAQLINSSKIFPNCHCILFLDNIHLFEQSASHQKVFPFESNILLYLLHSLEEHNVFVIATALHKGLLNSNITKQFDTKVSLGILSLQQRKHLIRTLLKHIENCTVDCDYLAYRTAGFVAGDLALFFNTLLYSVKSSELKNGTIDVSTEEAERILLTMTPSLLNTSKWNLKVKPIYWQDIGGMQDIKERLHLCIEKPLLHPEIFRKVDLPTPRGVLLFGPPGCCKTTIARGLATECKANFFAASPSQIYSPFVGESEKNISQLFYEAKLCMPSIIFLDELDCLVGRREIDSKMIGVAEKVLSTLLTEMDGFGVSAAYDGGESPQKYLSYCGDDKMDANERMLDQVVVIAATNRPDLIDDALLRPGRFDMILYIPPPNFEEREKILETYTSGLPLLNVNLRKIAKRTEHFSGADLKHLHTMAGLTALRKDENAEYISEEDFLDALETVKPSISSLQIQMYEQMASKYGTFISK